KLNDVILDPFLGSGTSIIAAEQCNRFCIGYEFNEKFSELIHSRINSEIPNAIVKFIT
ncbi:MAG: site-specific DNA-methyltransferase, partial [Clostridia bacterium]|nr:site-specific DNA-methyltransferase [Clostridia bacterium]